MKSLRVLLWLLLPALSYAQSADVAFAPASVSAKGAFFAVSVPDLEASTKWYTEKFGLKVTMQIKDKVSVTVLAGGGLIVELIHSNEAKSRSQAAPAVKDDIGLHGFSKAGILVDDFDKTLATLKARNVEIAYGPFPAKEDTMKNVIIRDNAGNLIQLFGK
jgi:catechol 2,3-dioxygenase-like lactoylglutathione lyase family enzyme